MAVTGGDALRRHLEQLAQRLSGGEVLRAGFLEGATYSDSGESVATVAAANEFGRPENNQPPRPFFRLAIAKNKERWGRGLGKLILQGRPVEQAMLLTGEVVRGDIQASIRELNDPALAPATAARKGFEKPLIDTSHMINSVDYQVKKE